jgi:hypothetical protein
MLNSYLLWQFRTLHRRHVRARNNSNKRSNWGVISRVVSMANAGLEHDVHRVREKRKDTVN